MNDPEHFETLRSTFDSDGAQAAVDRLIETLDRQQDYHRLFDALLIREKLKCGAPLIRPTALDDVDEPHREAFEAAYVDAARHVGKKFLDNGDIAQAWLYFRTIREPEKVRDAIEQIPSKREPDDRTEELIQIALYDGAHPVKGLELLLHSHGTCNTVTAMDQQLMSLSNEDRSRAAALLVDTIYNDLLRSIQADIERRMPMTPPTESLKEAIAGREWLFDENNYHIDVSHLNAVVRFARALDTAAPQMARVRQLAEYGSHLAEQFQYPADAPFDDFYTAHKHYFNIVCDHNRDGSLQYFRDKLDNEPDDRDKQMIAYVLVDLLQRIDRPDEAVEMARHYLKDLDDPQGFSFSQLCQRCNRLDVLQDVAREKQDLVSFTAAMLSRGSAT